MTDTFLAPGTRVRITSNETVAALTEPVPNPHAQLYRDLGVPFEALVRAHAGVVSLRAGSLGTVTELHDGRRNGEPRPSYFVRLDGVRSGGRALEVRLWPRQVAPIPGDAR